MLIEWKSAPDDEVAGIDSFGRDELLIGTSQGKLISTAKQVQVVNIKNNAELTSLLAISQDLALVFYERNGKTNASVFEAPTIQGIAGLTFHDVNGGMLYHHRINSKRPESSSPPNTTVVIVFTSAALRFIKFDINGSPKAKVLRTIEMKGIIAGCMSPHINAMLVATSSEYQLVDPSTGAKTPLFPILNDLRPLMDSLGPDFLVVQGTSLEDPAMGLFVDKNGEVARNGVIVQWPSYPTDLVISGDMIITVCSGEVLAHAVVDDGTSPTKVEQVTLNLPHGPTAKRVFKLSHAVHVWHDKVHARLGDIDGEEVSKIATHIAFLLPDNRIYLLKPIPELLKVEALINESKIDQIPKDKINPNDDIGKSHFRYSSAYLILHCLNDPNKTKVAMDAWRGANDSLSPALVLYLFGHSNILPANVYPGLIELVTTLRSKSEQLDVEFLKYFLRNEIKRLRRSASPNLDMLKKMELLYAQLIHSSGVPSEHSLTRFLLEKGQHSKAEIIEWLEEQRDHEELRYFYSFTDNGKELTKLNLRMLRQPDLDPATAQNISKQVAEYVKSSNNTIGHIGGDMDDWSIAMELLNNPLVDSSMCLDIIMSPKFEKHYDPATILEVLKEKTDSGDQWRIYLKHLVNEKGLFKDDLVTLLLNDLIDFVESHKEARKTVDASFTSFAKEAWPKPSYQSWIKSQRANSVHYPAELLNIQSELWDLMRRGLDWVSLMPSFDARLSEFKLERAIIYGQLGLIEQSIRLFKDITDYENILVFAQQFEDPDMRVDVVLLSFKVVLEIESPNKNQILRDFLKSEAASCLEIGFVLESLPDSRPFYAVADFVKSRISEQEGLEYHVQRLYALSKANLR